MWVSRALHKVTRNLTNKSVGNNLTVVTFQKVN